MNIDDSETSEKRYTLRPSYIPLPSKVKANIEGNRPAASTEPNPAHANEPDRNAQVREGKTEKVNSVLRAANEDDDLYDPYSDYHDGTLKAAEFEEDPWR